MNTFENDFGKYIKQLKEIKIQNLDNEIKDLQDYILKNYTNQKLLKHIRLLCQEVIFNINDNIVNENALNNNLMIEKMIEVGVMTNIYFKKNDISQTDKKMKAVKIFKKIKG